MRKGLDERIDEGILQWFGHVDRDRITKRVYVGECAGRHSVGSPQKRGTDNVKECLKKRGFDIRQARRMVQDRSEWRGFYEGECMGHEPLAWTRYNSYMKPLKGGFPFVAKPTT